MSRIGKKPVFLPAGVTATIVQTMDVTTVAVKGPKGELSLSLHPHTSVAELKDDEGRAYLEVTVLDGEREDRAMWGTMRALLAQMVEGITTGFKKALELNGVGFKMNLQGQTLVMSLGFSHEVRYTLPPEVAGKIEQNILTLTSANCAVLGQCAAEIRSLKKPEPYKGKGFRYTDEIIRRKAGKASKTSE
jgi:large subunit ribosomal protein L6